MTTEHYKLVQIILKEAVEPDLLVDGIFGNNSIRAAQKWINWSFVGAKTKQRWAAAVIQKAAAKEKINAGTFDAFYGPQTRWAADELIRIRRNDRQSKRPDEFSSKQSTTVKLKCWSPKNSDMRNMYGTEGENQDMAYSPYPLALDWNLSKKIVRFSCHKKVKLNVELALQKVMAHYGDKQIKELGLDRFGGCLNVRKKRGGTTMSNHSWGCAIDWYPSQNQLSWGRDRALFAKPEYKAFLDIWEELGWMSLGKCFNFDWMHVEKTN